MIERIPMGIRLGLLHGACWTLGGHDFTPSPWREGSSPGAWVREIACCRCGKQLRREGASGALSKPLDIWSGA